ncbi:hypothetical protein RHMOL_Rhmol02G0229700 [Rhododendron molle]|uniref:Uncharacterized protein n=1 Tax=Rhododendron molle TaxID=49168 RepID=A0ACC0PUI6_RHOML|nr:hypothetical protein RHMOL_Rhmol02G0229700 [Rhododendron molle]
MLAWVQSVGLKYGIVAASCRSAFLVVKEEESTNRHGIRLKGNACKETLGLKNAIAHFNCEVYQNIHTKRKDPSNTTGIKSIYNANFSNKTAKLDGLTPIQYVISQLLKKDYFHQFHTNTYTNEITNIIWVHPMSLELSINFSSVLIIDATYKTNEYQKSLLELWVSYPHGELTRLCSHILVMREKKH